VSNESEPKPTRWRGAALDVLIALVVAGLGAKAGYGAARARDLDLGDEGAYALCAARVPEHGLPAVEGSPLYIAWARALLAGGTPLDELTHVSWAGLAVLLPLSILVLARALGAGRCAALAVAGFVPATTLIDVWPYPLHLAACVLALGTAVAARLPRALGGATLGLALLTATYARPEFWYSVLLFAPLALVGAGFALRRGRARAAGRAGLVFAGGAAALVLAFGSPVPTGARSVVALGQHYAFNRHLTGEPIPSPWQQWETYFRADFGDANGVGAALRNNPRAFCWHVRQNAARAPEVLLSVALPRLDFTYLNVPHLWFVTGPHTWFGLPNAPHAHAEMSAGRVVAGVAALGLLGFVFGLRNWRRGEADARPLPMAALALVLVVAPAVAASLLVFPRFHYAVPTVAFCAALAAAGFRHLPVRRPALGARGEVVALVLLATLFAFVVPNRAKGVCVQSKLWKSAGGQRIFPVPTFSRDSVRAMRALNLPTDTVILDHINGRAYFAGLTGPVHDPFALPPGTDLRAFVARANVGLILIDGGTASCPSLKDDPEMKELFAGRETPTFRIVTATDPPAVLLAVRRDLLPK
jgi:hypothetical protein